MARRDYAELKLRLREDLRAEIEKAAAAADVSMNQWLVDRLEDSFDEERYAIEFRAAIKTLAGGDENAELLGMLAQALGALHSLDPDNRPANMLAFMFAAAALSAASAGMPFQYSAEEFDALLPGQRRGILTAEAVLIQRGLPGMLPAEVHKTRRERASNVLRKLMGFPELTEAEVNEGIEDVRSRVTGGGAHD